MDAFTHVIYNRPFWGSCGGYWEDSLLMAPVMYQNMLEIC